MKTDFELTQGDTNSLKELKERFQENESYNIKICRCGHNGKQHDSHSYITYRIYCYLCNCQSFTFK